MYKTPIFFDSVFKEKIWGGTALRDYFSYQIPSDTTGEYWAISAHPNGQSKVRDGKFKEKTLGELWKENRELFGDYPSDKFPLLIKIIDASQDLSVQVHPDDRYAKKYENGELGKTECWYIIDCKRDAEIIYGHNAKTTEGLKNYINNNQWDQLLRRISIKPGDFFYVPSGTIHALCEGTLVLETQQSSDTTYRVYDYDRLDQEQRKRELHLEKAIDVINVPHQDIQNRPSITEKDNVTITNLIESEFFNVYKWTVNGKASFEQKYPFLIISVIDGSGELIIEGDNYKIKKSDHLLIPVGIGEFFIQGQIMSIVSCVNFI